MPLVHEREHCAGPDLHTQCPQQLVTTVCQTPGFLGYNYGRIRVELRFNSYIMGCNEDSGLGTRDSGLGTRDSGLGTRDAGM